MLEPGRRRLFLETLRPPDGYLLDRAVGTTFTLDLMALLSVPLAFTFRDAQDGDGQLATEPLSLLESARRYAGRIVVFSQGGYTGVPRADQPALAFIEESVVAVFPPARSELGAIFHPKVWVLRYVPRDDMGDHPVRYRLVCQSRNLTFDSSWDVSLVLDGELNENRVNAYSINHPLADFVERLPSLAPGPVSSFQQESTSLLSDELRRVRWDPPEGLELSRFLPFGLRRANPAYPDLERRRLLVISPFLDGEFLRSITRRRRHSVLVSRREALLTASPRCGPLVREGLRLQVRPRAGAGRHRGVPPSAGRAAREGLRDRRRLERASGRWVGELDRGCPRQSSPEHRVHGRARGQEESIRHRCAAGRGSGG